MPTIIEGVSHLDTTELAELLKDKSRRAIVIDVREPHEYIAGHIPKVPLIPMSEIVGCIDQLDKDREYVFVCRSGQRSFNVAHYFQQVGFNMVHNYAGGMLDWDGEITEGPENIAIPFDPHKLERN